MRAVLLVVLVLAVAAGDPGKVHGQTFNSIVSDRCRMDVWNVNHISGWQVQWPALAASVPVATPSERAEALKAWRRLPAIIDQEIKALQKGLREGVSAPRPVVEHVIKQARILLESPRETSPLWSPLRRSDNREFVKEWTALIHEELVPSIQSYLAFLEREYLEASREEIGLVALPGGRLCYEHVVERWTTLDVSPDELRSLGEAQLKSLHEELQRIAGKHFEMTASELIAKMRAGEVGEKFQTGDDVLRHARETLDRARKALPKIFSDVPEIHLEVEPVPPHKAESAPAGFYIPPSGATAHGTYLVNTLRQEDRRLMAEAIAFHEGLPGHHYFWTEISQVEDQQPYNAGFAEGWAIYAERLAEELDLYSTPIDQAGMLVKHMWATSRLVVDPGIHVYGWTREDAIEYMRQHTALGNSEIEVEVDRYIALPGQSLSYMLGYLELRRLRDLAQTDLGDRFDIREFHDVLLRDGMVSLSDLENQVEDWIRSVSEIDDA